MSHWFTRSAVCTSSAPRSLRPLPWRGASRCAGVGRVRKTDFLTILWDILFHSAIVRGLSIPEGLQKVMGILQD